MALRPHLPHLKDDRGQATVEYILLLTIVMFMYSTIWKWFATTGFSQRLAKPITTDFAKAYQLGDIKAEGLEDGSPKRHARATGCEECFRIFINPKF